MKTMLKMTLKTAAAVLLTCSLLTPAALAESAVDATTSATSTALTGERSTTVFTDVVDMLANDRTNWNFTDEAISLEDLQTILTAGVNTSSAMNAQPWVFTVITDKELLAELGAVGQAPVGILVSVDNSNEMKIVDAGLAAQTMYITAKAMGYGAKIETGAARTVRNNPEKYMDRLNIPENMSARALVLIGHIDEAADAVSGASTRNDFDQVVVYPKN